MSIRLRLTLIYTAILALTLIAFGSALYIIQAQATYGDIKTALTRQGDGFANAFGRPRGRGEGPPPDPNSPGRTDLPPSGFTLPGRWTQIRNTDGTVVARTGDLGDADLPLSAAGLSAVQGGLGWFESAQFQGEPLLIYSQPLNAGGRLSGIVQVAAPMAEREQSLDTLRLILIVASGFAILAAFGAGWVLAGTALSPIERITHTAQAIGAEHNFSRRVDHVGPNDEIGQLATTFNGMLTELESAYRQQEEALVSQRRFVADASHELRTPLTTIRGNVELLRHEPPMNAKDRSEALEDTKGEVERMMRLVNQLLVLARADAGQPPSHERLEIKPLLDDVCRETRLTTEDLVINCNASPDAVIMGDADALKQVFLILLDNARTHTPPGTTMNVTSAVNHNVVIRFQDTGPGIAPEVLPHIFERFYRGDESRTGTSTGLGLSIAKELVEAQGGTITVESQPGQGTLFAITFPRAKT